MTMETERIMSGETGSSERTHRSLVHTNDRQSSTLAEVAENRLVLMVG